MDLERRRYNSPLPTLSRTARHGPVRKTGVPHTPHRPVPFAVLRWVQAALNLIASGRSFVTEAHQTGADVRSLTEALIAHAQGAGGQITSAEVVQTVESAEVTPAQAKKILRALVDAGVTVVVDGSAPTRRKVAAARAATPASKATTAKAAPVKKAAPAAAKATEGETEATAAAKKA